MMKKNYSGKNCIIFGYNNYIGKTIGHFLAQKNVKLGLIDLTKYEDKEGLKEIKNNPKILYHTVKSGNKKNVDATIDEMVSKMGNIDYLICSFYIEDIRANISEDDLSLEIWETLFQDWILNYFLILKAIVPNMIEAKGGKVIFINTTTGYTGEGEGEGQITLSGSIHESACSSGITGMMTSIAADIIPQGVSINGIALGSDYEADVERILWTVHLWLSGLGDYSCGQIIRLY